MRLIAMIGAIALSTPLAAQPPAAPAGCAADPLFRQQDFTLGHWDVFTGGSKTAEVKMERALDGCAIHETWIKPGGGAGQGLGLFTYSRVLRAWSYAWASDEGAATFFTGSLTGPNDMLYVTERPAAGGSKRLRHWTLTVLPDGRIRELSRGTEDGGKSWITEYELFWAKHGA